MKELTEKQRLVLDFIRGYMHQNGMAPTHAEIAEGLGWASANNSQFYLQALHRKGWLRIRRGVSRGIVLTENPAASVTALVPDGWQLVPIEPTTKQWAAGFKAMDSGIDKPFACYRAMLAAAPEVSE